MKEGRAGLMMKMRRTVAFFFPKNRGRWWRASKKAQKAAEV